MKKVIFIASTGGHLNQLLGLNPIFKNYDYYVITEKTKSNISLKEKYDKRINYLIFGSKEHFFTYIFKYICYYFCSIFYFIKIKPDYIITTGTHTAVPLCIIANIFKKKVVFIETRSSFNKITLSGRIVAPFADMFVIQNKSLLGLSKSKNEVLCEM